MSEQAIYRLPLELRERPQWCLAALNEKGEYKVPTFVDTAGNVRLADHGDPSTWLEFEDAVSYARELRMGIGYCMHPDDPFTVVDLDVKTQESHPDKPELWSTPEDLERLHSICRHLDSYTELSQSRRGVHIWTRGKIGRGRHRDGVEMYSQTRFMVCTGESIHTPPKPIADRQAMLTNMASLMDEISERPEALIEGTTDLSDEELWNRATGADNAAKFNKLWRGEWADMGYPSQSEADLSLMSMLTFYSRDNEQCRRLFRRSALGQREKAVKNDRYLDYTLRLIRGRQKREDDALSRVQQQADALMERLRHPVGAGVATTGEGAPDAAGIAAALAYSAQLQAQGPTLHPAPERAPTAPPAPATEIQWPPGLTGAIAQFIYGAAPRPVREVAIVSALGWMAGVCGKAWVIPGSGLNLYLILVARSAVGKEAMHTGLGALTHRLRESLPICNNFVTFDDFASGPALAKACAANPSFLHVAGEFGRKLQQFANGANGPLQTLRTTMTHLYQKSGPASIVGGISYSNKDSNVAAISGVAYSMLGETTPDTLYAALTQSMMEDGFLSRFTMVEYNGTRPPLNQHAVIVPHNDLVAWCHNLCHAAGMNIGKHTPEMVRRTDAAQALMDAFDAECDVQINATNEEAKRQMWNRAHLKVCRIAALLCIGCNHTVPVIDVPHVEWAIDLIRRDIAIMANRMASGDVGQGDEARHKKLLHIMHEFLTKPLGPGYGVPQAMQRDGVVPRKYLQQRVASVAAFYQHPLGSKRALDDAIQNCVDSGWMVEIPKEKAGEAYTFQGRCFRVVQLPPDIS